MTPSRRALLVGASVLAASAGLAVSLARPRRAPAPPSPSATAERPSVAVLRLDNRSGRADTAWMSAAVAELLTLELSGSSRLRVVPADDVFRCLADADLPLLAVPPDDALPVLARRLGADVLVLGSYVALQADRVQRVSIRAVAPARPAVLFQAEVADSDASLAAVVRRLGERVRSHWQEPPPTRAAPVLPATAPAARAYSDGVERLRAFDAAAARVALEAAVAADPEFPLAHVALAEAWAVLGYDGRSLAAARRAFLLGARLPPRQRLAVEARQSEAAREWDRALEVRGTLVRLFPDDLDLRLGLAAAQVATGRGAEALEGLREARRLGLVRDDDPRVDLYEARAANVRGDLEVALGAARRSAARADAAGARLLAAQARLEEQYALRTLGRPAEASAAGDAARRLFRAAGDLSGVARSLLETAGQQRYQGDLGDARRSAEEALALARRIGDQNSVSAAANRIASVLKEEGRLAAAAERYELARTVAVETGARNHEATALNNIGVTFWLRGMLREAEERIRACLAIAVKTAQARTRVYATFNLGFVRFERGDLAGARAAHQQALAEARTVGDRSLEATALFGLGETLRAEDDLPGAREVHAKALALREQVGSRGYAAESKAALADLALEGGQAEEAERLARDALAEFRRQGARPNAAEALAILALAALARGDHPRAAAALGEAKETLAEAEHRFASARVLLVEARVHPSRTVLARVSEEMASARQEERAVLAWQCALALAHAAGGSGRGAAHARTVAAEASRAGYRLLARHAAAAARR